MVTLPRTGLAVAVCGRLAGAWQRWTQAARPPTLGAVDEAEREHAKELWTAARYADWLGVSRQNVHERLERGTLKPHYFAQYGNRTFYLFDPARVKHWRKHGANMALDLRKRPVVS